VSGDHFIQFESVPWRSVSEYAREKRIVANDRVVRILELATGFHEPTWCCNPHIGYVVAGELQLVLENRTESLRAGDAMVLAGGENGKHKAEVRVGMVTLFLIEPA
jgi:hypothetical protein